MPGIKDGPSTAKSQKFRWEDEGLIERLIERLIKRLIELYEARPCLWDIADPTYSKRDVREKALFSCAPITAESFSVICGSIKPRIFLNDS